jgi:hypothetical protein
MMRFKGIYNLSVPYDLNTKNFVRDETGNFANYHDVRIDCKDTDYICHQGGSILKACFESKKRRNNIIKKLDSSIVLGDITPLDFTFHAKNITVVAKIMGAKTRHKNRSPFSVLNLPKNTYQPKNPLLCKEVSQLILDKYGLGNYREKIKYYLKKFKIKPNLAERRKLIYWLDEYDKLGKVKELELG